MVANDVLLVSKIILGYEEALWPNKLTIVRFWFFLTTVKRKFKYTEKPHNFEKISKIVLTLQSKYKICKELGDIFQVFAAFSEYLNLNCPF